MAKAWHSYATILGAMGQQETDARSQKSEVFERVRAPETITRPTAWSFAWAPWLLALLVGMLALVPRAAGLADFVTTDEVYHWIGRVERFSAALAARDWPATSQTGHPGVTLMWLGSLGLWLEHAAAGASGVVAHLAWLRLPHAIIEAGIV